MESLPQFLFATRSLPERRRLAQLKQEGRIRRIGPRLYTSLPEAEVARAAGRAWGAIVSGLYPGALVSHRTALEYGPSPEGVVFLTALTNRQIAYPGLTLELVRGPKALPDDPRYMALRASSLPRALLENLSHDPRWRVPRTVPVEALERRLELLLRDGGEAELNRLRDRAREIAEALRWQSEFRRLDELIGALLGTRADEGIRTRAARARALGAPYDTACLGRLQLLAGELRTRAVAAPREATASPAHFRHKAFFEAYFSNYIEGTELELEEAEAIVFDGKIPTARPADAHDIAGTFAIVSDPDEMRRAPTSPESLAALLRARHAALLAARPDKRPGAFKERPNRAGDTHFVAPDLVAGTLEQGYALYRDLAPGLPRAIFMMFLVADVHPFDDGNGRIARVMMNAELVAAGASTIIIPTVFRDDYLTALRALTRRDRPTPLVDALARAAAFSHLDFTALPKIRAELRRRNWFHEPDEARLITGPLPPLSPPPLP